MCDHRGAAPRPAALPLLLKPTGHAGPSPRLRGHSPGPHREWVGRPIRQKGMTRPSGLVQQGGGQRADLPLPGGRCWLCAGRSRSPSRPSPSGTERGGEPLVRTSRHTHRLGPPAGPEGRTAPPHPTHQSGPPPPPRGGCSLWLPNPGVRGGRLLFHGAPPQSRLDCSQPAVWSCSNPTGCLEGLELLGSGGGGGREELAESPPPACPVRPTGRVIQPEPRRQDVTCAWPGASSDQVALNTRGGGGGRPSAHTGRGWRERWGAAAHGREGGRLQAPPLPCR